MTITAGIDVGSGTVKAVVMQVVPDGPNSRTNSVEQVLASHASRIRRRDVADVIDEAFKRAVAASGVDAIDYVATTGEGEDINFATGHFYGMTTHARGALFLAPEARAVLDVGSLHARAVAMDQRGKVLGYKMTSQCASGSGQFLENIARYLGVSLAEVGTLSLSVGDGEKVSSICAVLAETDVINMVSRGISPPAILRGIHDSMGGRFARLVRAVKAEGTVFMSGGLAGDVGLKAAIARAIEGDKRRTTGPVTLVNDPLSIHAGAIGAAIWGAYRHACIANEEPAWTAA
jgi:benzoyl-CoA reductase subunit D